jgi:poly-beta-1,6-N-acetyl-D-glucosamine synthase
METLFWASALLVAYVYAGYPLLLVVWSAVATRPVRKRSTSDSRHWPRVSVIVAAHNEAARLPRRVANLLEQVYPHPLEIIVVSDGSTDDPRSALAPFTDDGVILLELPRGGKPTALNAGVAAATGEIVVFADARQTFAHDSILHLVANFSDPHVGGVTGELILDAELTPAADSTVGDGVGLYWRYEKWLRRRESRICSTLGATGALYALRRELWSPLPAETLLDDVLAPMRVVLAKKRIVFEERARAFDRVSSNGSIEARRKTRTLAGNYQILLLEPRLLIPFVNPVWVQYLSHKVGRLLVPWALLTTFVASVVLAVGHWPYLVALILQLVFYGLAAFGAWIDSTERQTSRADEVPCRRRESRVTAP